MAQRAMMASAEAVLGPEREKLIRMSKALAHIYNARRLRRAENIEAGRLDADRNRTRCGRRYTCGTRCLPSG